MAVAGRQSSVFDLAAISRLRSELRTTDYGPQKEIRPTGIRSGDIFSFVGGGGGIRTPDLYSAIVALSQLSYAPAEQFGEYTEARKAASICTPTRQYR